MRKLKLLRAVAGALVTLPLLVFILVIVILMLWALWSWSAIFGMQEADDTAIEEEIHQFRRALRKKRKK